MQENKTDMENANQDSYEVISEGTIRPGISKKKVSDNLQKLFNKNKENIAPIIGGKPLKVKAHLNHRDAYKLQQALLKSGVEARLNRIPAQEQATEYTLVPEGEETTPFEDLAKRHREGETVICKHCHCEQQLAPYCSECGKQLIAKAGAMPPEVTIDSTFPIKTVVISIILLTLLGIAIWLFAL